MSYRWIAPAPADTGVGIVDMVRRASHLLGNVALAQAIKHVSNGRYEAVLPQDLEVTNKRGKAIRDFDILTLLSCDLALFHFDGTELDSGTVAEFMLAKFADIPTVLLRTDFRKAGDNPTILGI